VPVARSATQGGTLPLRENTRRNRCEKTGESLLWPAATASKIQAGAGGSCDGVSWPGIGKEHPDFREGHLWRQSMKKLTASARTKWQLASRARSALRRLRPIRSRSRSTPTQYFPGKSWRNVPESARGHSRFPRYSPRLREKRASSARKAARRRRLAQRIPFEITSLIGAAHTPVQSRSFNLSLARQPHANGETLPSSLSAQTRPPCICTMCFTMLSPRPVPPVSGAALVHAVESLEDLRQVGGWNPGHCGQEALDLFSPVSRAPTPEGILGSVLRAFSRRLPIPGSVSRRRTDLSEILAGADRD